MTEAITPDTKQHFSRTLRPPRLHFAAHSHHPWPDVTFGAQQQAWLDAAAHLDDKWSAVADDVMATARGYIAGRIGTHDPDAIVTATNTHELVLRLLSCLPPHPRIVTTDAEFHSFRRQMDRLEEAGRADVVRVPAEPFDTLAERLLGELNSDVDMLFVSEVAFNSGHILGGLPQIAAAAGADTFVVIDGYHAFMARPIEISAMKDRVFYLAGGYKYAMAGEGACWMHCPDGYGLEPVNTGWYAEFEDLAEGGGSSLPYARRGGRFMGATHELTPWYRFNAVQELLDHERVNVATIHAHARRLQTQFLDGLDSLALSDLTRSQLMVTGTERGNFLTFRSESASRWVERLREQEVITDHRGDRLRIGFGIYQDGNDVDALLTRLAVA